MKCVHRGEFVARIKVACGTNLQLARAFKCSKLGRCLPFFQGPWNDEQKEHEAKIYHLCHGCELKSYE